MPGLALRREFGHRKVSSVSIPDPTSVKVETDWLPVRVEVAALGVDLQDVALLRRLLAGD